MIRALSLKTIKGITLIYYVQEENTRYQLYRQHPELQTVWKELDAKPRITVEKDKQPDGLSLTMLPFQLEGLHWLRCQEETGFKGGILADEMGMGKTIQTIGLLMSEPRAKPNLVVAPTVALVQWKNEIEKHTNNALSVIVYHGANREVDVKKLAEADVIMTTYSVLESMYRKQTTGFKRKDGIYKEDSALHKMKFHRVILDEAHNIKVSFPRLGFNVRLLSNSLSRTVRANQQRLHSHCKQNTSSASPEHPSRTALANYSPCSGSSKLIRSRTTTAVTALVSRSTGDSRRTAAATTVATVPCSISVSLTMSFSSRSRTMEMKGPVKRRSQNCRSY